MPKGTKLIRAGIQTLTLKPASYFYLKIVPRRPLESVSCMEPHRTTPSPQHFGNFYFDLMINSEKVCRKCAKNYVLFAQIKTTFNELMDEKAAEEELVREVGEEPGGTVEASECESHTERRSGGPDPPKRSSATETRK